MVAHNLRAPVARLLGLSRIFRQTANTDPIRDELIEKIEKSANDFDLIIKDISLMLEVKKGLRFSMENIHLFHEIQNSILFLDEEIKEVKARITLQVDKHHQVFAMRPYVKSIFTNLLSNSIKYRQLDKDLEIKISSAVMVDKIRITVSDNGLGIDLIQNKDKIFEPFKRFHTHREGRGLGLHLVKAEIEAMGGEIGVESALGKGTTFTIFLQHPKT
jgi:signal transduction histidine kinase